MGEPAEDPEPGEETGRDDEERGGDGARRPGPSVPGAGDAEEAAAKAARPPEPPRAFAVGYERQSGDMLVWGGLALAILGVVAAFVNGSDAFLVMTAAGLASAGYFWPLVERKRPQLGASTAGLYVDRIGIVGWPAVESLDIRQTALRSIELATMVVKLRVPLEKAVVAEERVPLTKRFTTRNWKLVDGDRIEVRLHTLTAHPPDLFERIRAFHVYAGAMQRP